MVIQHNLLSLNTNRNLKVNVGKQRKISEKVASGYRINRAADDTAGLMISEKLREQIRGLDQASLNAQDGISLIQTAEGALGEIHSLLHRIRELSVQAANDINQSSDRDAIQKEVDELVKQVDEIANNTEFNKMKLLDGSIAGADDALAPYRRPRTLSELLAADTDGINIIYEEYDYETTATPFGNATAAGYTSLKNELQTSIVPQAVKSILKAYSPAFDYLSSSSIGIGLSIGNKPSSSTLASVSIGYYTSSGSKLQEGILLYKLTVNAGTLTYDASGNLDADGRRKLETTIAHEMVHAIMDESLTNGMIGASNGNMDSSNKFPSWFTEGMAQTAAGGYSNDNDWVNGGLGITTASTLSQIESAVKSSANRLSSGSTSSQYGTGYLACMYLGYLANGGNAVNASGISKGLSKVLSELIGGKNLNTVIQEQSGGLYTSIADFQNKFGDAKSVQFIADLTQAAGSTGNGGLASGNLADNDLLSNSPASINLFKLDTTNDTIKNIYPPDVSVFTGGGSRIDGAAYDGSTGGFTGGGGRAVDPNGLWLQIGANYNQGIYVTIGGAGIQKLEIDALSVKSHADAGEAIEKCDGAIWYISRIRGKLGAFQNRLEYAAANSDNQSENTQQAESTIRDMDMSDGMVEHSKNQILIQAGQAVLAQANQVPDGILKLLG